MKRKKLPAKKHKGLFIYCSKCKKYFAWTKKKEKDGMVEPFCGDSGKKYSSCSFVEKQSYKVRTHIPGTTKGLVSKVLSAQTYNEAVVQAVEFAEGFKSEVFGQTISYDTTTRRAYLKEAQGAYIGFLANVDVPIHKQRIRSKAHIRDIIRSLRNMNEALQEYQINPKLVQIAAINEKHVGYIHDFLEKRYQNRTYNKHISQIKYFFKWAITTYRLKQPNFFAEIKKKRNAYNKETITKEEFQRLIAQLSYENGWYERKVKNEIRRENAYNSYLKDAFRLGLHTGGRREEVIMLKWNMIHEIKGVPSYIAINNFKVERMLRPEEKENVKPKIIPITTEFFEVLSELGYEEHKGSDTFMIFPERKGKMSSTIMNNITTGFSHFYNQLNTDRDLKFKCLRKTYLTYLNAALKGETKTLSSHANDSVLKKHYIDEKVINKAVKDVRIFG